jgi:hypothetical protein
MTAEKLQDPVSTPVTAHLTPVQRALFNQALSAYLSDRATAVPIEAEFGVKVISGDVTLTFAGAASGELQYLRINDPDFGANAETKMALLHVQESTGDQPPVHFLTAAVTVVNGEPEVTDVKVLDLAEMFNRVLEVEYRHNNTGCRAVCPLSGEVFKPYFGEYPFLAGTWDPVFEGSLPPAGPENPDPSRARWTVGEVQAFMVSQWRTALAARKESAPAAPALSQVDCPF